VAAKARQFNDRAPDLIPVNDPSEIPAFADEEEEALFWSTHGYGPGMLGRDLYRLPLSDAEIDRVSALAERREVGWAALIRTWVLERLAVEEGR
jgi:hypothetical protein